MNGSTSTPDILGLVNREITPEVIHRAALQLGEDDDRLRSALSTTVPSVLTALSDVASSETGASHLTRVIRGIDANRPGADSVASILGSTAGRAQGTTLFDGETGARASQNCRRGGARERDQGRLGAPAAGRGNRRHPADHRPQLPGARCRGAAVDAGRTTRRLRAAAPGAGCVDLRRRRGRRPEGRRGRREAGRRAARERGSPAIRRVRAPEREVGWRLSSCSGRWC